MPNHSTPEYPRTPKFFEVRDFKNLQYRTDRSLPWIQLYTSLLDDPEFEQLPDATKFHYVGLLLLARRSGEHLPYNAEYLARKIGANSNIDLALLLQKKFITSCKRKKTKAEAGAQKTPAVRTECVPEERRGEEIKTTTDETGRPTSPVSVGGDVVRGVFGSDSSNQTSQSAGSAHSPDIIRLYLEDCQRQGQDNIRNLDAVVATLHRTGRSDQVIQSWLDRQASATRDTTQCPDCHGAGLYYPQGFDKGVAKCKHESLSDNFTGIAQCAVG